MTEKQVSNTSRASPRHLPDASWTPAGRLPDASRTPPGHLPDGSRTLPRRLPGACRAALGWFSDHSEICCRCCCCFCCSNCSPCSCGFCFSALLSLASLCLPAAFANASADASVASPVVAVFLQLLVLCASLLPLPMLLLMLLSPPPLLATAASVTHIDDEWHCMFCFAGQLRALCVTVASQLENLAFGKCR